MPKGHRHSRARARYHFVRVALKRRRAYLNATSYSWPADGGVDLSLGRFADEQPYLGCRRARCGLCRPGKRWHRGADRMAFERAWRRDWADELP